jgi:hypothetical protein
LLTVPIKERKALRGPTTEKDMFCRGKPGS